INGTEIVRRVAHFYKNKTLACGTLITIPLLNVYGFIQFTRDVADGKDVNRSFPGSAKGSLASRIANILYKTILPHVNVMIDFHTGGAQRYNYPQVRYSKNDEASFELAKIFAAPFIMESPLKPNSLRQYGVKLKIPNLAYEGGEAGRFDGFSIDKGILGIKNVLHYYKLIESSTPMPHQCVSLNDDRWIRASYSGIFVWNRSSGAYISKGEILGTISDPDNVRIENVKSRISGYIIGHNNATVVHVGDALFHIGRG
ncbi:MAG: succinylglutamate desuccinylase/aspartoacylase family protein, partial [Saprospiraceae bacterium]